ncbi:hypothetical protein A6779_16045 [Marinobacter adhaerens]|nr:NB-ARC domain-containing protein [Marinobacter adhaerens]ODM28635.1 hypothetical protein A6779_16045 [Marinobacter adhaerens]
MLDGGTKKFLTPNEAAIYLGVTTELIFQFTKQNFAKASGLRNLKTIERDGKTWFEKNELIAFDDLLSGPWTAPNEPRPGIPKAILDHLRAESLNQCARCGSGAGVDTAHILSWATTRSHHPNNLIRICSNCHREHDSHQSLSSAELQNIKNTLVERTRYRLTAKFAKNFDTFRPPRCANKFFGRKNDLQNLIDKIQLNESAVISGVGGIGKSELLKQALWKSNIERRVLWFNVEQFADIEDLMVAFQTALSEDGSACDKEAIFSRLDDIRACVVFDGIEQNSFGQIETFEDIIFKISESTYRTQIIITSQAKLYRFRSDSYFELHELDDLSSRSLLKHSFPHTDEVDYVATDKLLALCDGHPLVIQFAGALASYYGGVAKALAAIEKHGGEAFRYPGRHHYDRKTSLNLCLDTAYSTLSVDCKKLLWTLALAPAGFLTDHLESNFRYSSSPADSMATLRRWHFLSSTSINERLSRTILLSPVRQFVMSRAKFEDAEEFEEVVRETVREFGVMVAVWEINYDSPEELSYIMSRYEMELANLVGTLKLAKERDRDQEIAKIAVSIARSLMRYFFVSRLPEQGAKVMFDAANIALRSSNIIEASSLCAQFMALAARSQDDSLTVTGIKLVEKIESSIESPRSFPDLAMAQAIAAQRLGDFRSSEKHARLALEGYRSHLSYRSSPNDTEECEDTHNNIADALRIAGFSLLSQKRYQEAKTAYCHALDHERGASIPVNRGQTLHQIANCEAYLGNHESASKLYFEAIKIFHSVHMEEYLSNAVGELGYTFLETYIPEILNHLDTNLVDHALSDIRSDILNTFALNKPLNHQFCIGIIRKLFGTIILISLTRQSEQFRPICTDLANSTTRELAKQIEHGDRSPDEAFPVMILDMLFHIGVLVSQAEVDALETGQIAHETLDSLMKIACTAHDWAHEVMRFTDWLSLYFEKRWSFRTADSKRIKQFIFNYKEGVPDHIELISTISKFRLSTI